MLVAGLSVAACVGCGGPADPSASGPQPPPAGPHFSIVPIPIERIARITPIGYNNKIIPTPHTYWMTCDIDFVLQGTRPCHRERLPIQAPTAGIVFDIDTASDGYLRVEGPPGLKWALGHVTPEPGLARGSRVSAGQVVARMFYDHGFDFGVINLGVNHFYLVPERYPEEYLHGENPIAQFPEPLRSELTSRSNSMSSALGKLGGDVAGTAAGAWFIQGTPKTNLSLQFGSEHLQLWLGRYVEREETRIVYFGQASPGQQNRLNAVDPSAPSWEDITPASGPVAVKLWFINAQATPNLSAAAGTVLVQLLSATTLRVEWFPTHSLVPDFTAAVRTYER
jgi:hypothetical protein